MNARVEQSLGDVQRAHARLLLHALQRHHELVHADAVIRHVVGVLQAVHHVVGIEHGVFRRLADARRPQRQDVAQGFEGDGEIAVKSAYLPHALFARTPAETAVRQKRTKERLAAHGAASRPAASVRGGKRLVQVEVHHVKTHVAGAHHAHDRVEVRAVVITKTARLVHDARNFQYIFVKQPNRVRVGEHQARRVRPDRRAQGR